MASKLTLDGGIALVTGAASGIGKECAIAFAEAGAKGVVFVDINLDLANAAAEESKKFAKHAEYRAVVIKVDVSDANDVESMIETAMKEFGRIDYAVHSAAIALEAYSKFLPDLKFEVFSKMLNVNVEGAMRVVTAVMGVMSKQEPLTYTGRHGSRSLGRGSITLLGSTSSLIAVPGMASYNTVKHAIIGIMKSAAVDSILLGTGIRVNAVCPAWVDTPLVQHGIEVNPAIRDMIDTITPLKRAATVDEIADYIVFLSSPSASFINGTAIPIDAGLSLPPPPPILSG